MYKYIKFSESDGHQESQFERKIILNVFLSKIVALTASYCFLKELLLWFPSPPLAVSNGKSTTQRLSVFVGHAPGVGYPSLCLIPDKLLSPWRVSSGYQPDSLWPGSIYNMYNGLFTIKICTILYTIPFTVNKIYFSLSYSTILFTVIFYRVQLG